MCCRWMFWHGYCHNGSSMVLPCLVVLALCCILDSSVSRFTKSAAHRPQIELMSDCGRVLSVAELMEWAILSVGKKFFECLIALQSRVIKKWVQPKDRSLENTREHFRGFTIYRVSQKEWTKLRESVPYVKIYRYNPKHLYPKLNGYGDNGQRSLKLWQLLHTWLPNSY